MSIADFGEIGRKRQAEMRANGELMVSHNPYQKIANLRDSGRKINAQHAINAMCWHCMGGSAHEWDAGIKADIKNCTSGPQSTAPCPLWDFRPYRWKA